jgi:hypothetical protein
MRLTRPDDLSEFLELLGANLYLADFEQAGEKLDEHFGQRLCPMYCLSACRGDCSPQGYATYLRLGLSVPDNRHGVDEGEC